MPFGLLFYCCFAMTLFSGHARITTIVTISSVVELISIACCMPLLLAYTPLSGVSAAFLTLVIGRIVGWFCLATQYKKATHGVPNKK